MHARTRIFHPSLQAGDLLYAPRGTIHQAVSLPHTHSFHVTLSTMLMSSWAEYMKLLLSHAVDVAFVEATDVAWRRGLPRNYFAYMGVVHNDKDDDPRRMRFAKHARELVKKLGAYLPFDVVADQSK
jgi:lysine-specific demethylase/histidyl-hydroxylase NO66